MNVLKGYALIVITLLVGSQTAYGYIIAMRNAIDEDVVIRMEYGGSAICGPEDIELKSGQARELNVGGCCPARLLKVRGVKSGAVDYFATPLTGEEVACRGFSMVVKKSGSLIVTEQGLE